MTMKSQSSCSRAPLLRSLSDVPSSFLCKVCSENPVFYVTRCLHTFCESCYEHLCAPALPLTPHGRSGTVLPSSSSPSVNSKGLSGGQQAFWGCLACRRGFPSETRDAMFLQLTEGEICQIEKLSASCDSSSSSTSSPTSESYSSPLKVNCLASNRGCSFASNLKELISHELNCEHLRFPCRGVIRGCPHDGPLAAIQKHSRTCRFVPGVGYCKYQRYGCKVRGSHTSLANHERKCHKVTQKLSVRCPFFKLGCGLKPRAYYLSEHVKSCLFRPDACVAKAGETLHHFELQLAYLPQAKEMHIEVIKENLSTFLPKIEHVKANGALGGGICVVFEKMPSKVVEGIIVATNSIVADNLKECGLVMRGITAI